MGEPNKRSMLFELRRELHMMMFVSLKDALWVKKYFPFYSLHLFDNFSYQLLCRLHKYFFSSIRWKGKKKIKEKKTHFDCQKNVAIGFNNCPGR